MDGSGKRDFRHKAKIWKTALYIRLSKEDGNETSLSVLNQKQRLMDYIAQTRDEPDVFEIAGVYIDDGYSGTDSSREAFQAMLGDIRQGTVNCVIVKDLSRLSRNYIEAGHYMEHLFTVQNVRFISLELPALDSYKNPEQMNSIIVPLQNVINDDFCRQTSIKIRGVFNAKRGRGEFIGGFAPYGYLKREGDKHSFMMDPVAAGVVKDIYHWYVYDGLSKRGIAKRLNAMGILSPAAYKKSQGLNYSCGGKVFDGLWSPEAVSRILANEVYTGSMVQGRYRIKSYKVHTQIRTPEEEWFIVKDRHEPIIDKYLFERAANICKRDGRAAVSGGSVHPFSGHIFCAGCKKAMHRQSTRGRVYYICRTYYDKSNQSCTKHSIRLDAVETAVLAAVNAQLALIQCPDTLIAEVRKETAGNKSVHQLALAQAIEKRKQDLARVQKVNENLYADWKSGYISKEEYLQWRDKYKKSGEEIRRDMETLEEKMTEAKNAGVSERPESYLKTGKVTGIDRQLIITMIKKIYIHENKDITIHFNFKDSLKQCSKKAPY